MRAQTIRGLLFSLLGIVLVTPACSRTTQSPLLAGQHNRTVTSAQQDLSDPAEAPEAAVQQQNPVVKVESRQTDQQDMSEAKKKLAEAKHLFSRGSYEKSEALLKEAITLFPFVPEANLLLGKIFLIRGAANRDLTMMDSARLMFEMAKAMDPENREVATLLELFRARRID